MMKVQLLRVFRIPALDTFLFGFPRLELAHLPCRGRTISTLAPTRNSLPMFAFPVLALHTLCAKVSTFTKQGGRSYLSATFLAHDDVGQLFFKRHRGLTNGYPLLPPPLLLRGKTLFPLRVIPRKCPGPLTF